MCEALENINAEFDLETQFLFLLYTVVLYR